MIDNIRESFNDLLSEVPWMDGKTREVARGKVKLCIQPQRRAAVTLLKTVLEIKTLCDNYTALHMLQ